MYISGAGSMSRSPLSCHRVVITSIITSVPDWLPLLQCSWVRAFPPVAGMAKIAGLAAGGREKVVPPVLHSSLGSLSWLNCVGNQANPMHLARRLSCLVKLSAHLRSVILRPNITNKECSPAIFMICVHCVVHIS